MYTVNYHCSNRGLLSAIARGKRRAPPSVLRALGLPIVVTAHAPVCPRCGVVHVAKSCPARARFAERAAHYDRWCARNVRRIARVVAWSESRGALSGERPAAYDEE